MTKPLVNSKFWNPPSQMVTRSLKYEFARRCLCTEFGFFCRRNLPAVLLYLKNRNQLSELWSNGSTFGWLRTRWGPSVSGFTTELNSRSVQALMCSRDRRGKVMLSSSKYEWFVGSLWITQTNWSMTVSHAGPGTRKPVSREGPPLGGVNL